MAVRPPESGIEELRRIVRAANMSRESSFDGLTAEQCLRLIRACWGSVWDVLPDSLTSDERADAAKSGKLSEACARRLDALWLMQVWCKLWLP